MKTSIYIVKAIKTIMIIAIIVTVHLEFLFAATPIDSSRVKPFSITSASDRSALESQKDELFNEIFLLSPATPAEASFDDNPDFASTVIFDKLAPKTPAEADFNE